MDTANLVAAIEKRLDDVSDPRTGNAKKHPLNTLLFCAIFGTLAGADSLKAVHLWTEAKQDWLEQFLSMPEGVPSHDTFCRVFSLLDPDELRACFLRWTRALARVDKDLVALDGKTLEQSFEDGDPETALTMVSAWASENGLTLAATGAEDGDELGAIEEIVELLDLEDCLVTVDALGCQRKLSRMVGRQEGDYLFAVKSNQGELAGQLEAFWEWALDEDRPADQETPDIDVTEEVDGGHGRVDIRKVWWCEATEMLQLDRKWPYIGGFARVEATRQLNDGTCETETRLYVSSLEDPTAEEVASAIRSHWEVENKVHWVMDMTYREDESRLRTENAAENMALIRRLTTNILREDDNRDTSLKQKRNLLSWDFDYFLKVLADGTAADALMR